MAPHTLERAQRSTSPAPAKAGPAAVGGTHLPGHPHLGVLQGAELGFYSCKLRQRPLQQICPAPAPKPFPESPVLLCGGGTAVPSTEGLPRGARGQPAPGPGQPAAPARAFVLKLSCPLPGSSKPLGQLSCSWKGTGCTYRSPPGREGTTSPSSERGFKMKSPRGLQSTDPRPGASALLSLAGVSSKGGCAPYLPRTPGAEPHGHLGFIATTISVCLAGCSIDQGKRTLGSIPFAIYISRPY